MSDLDPTRPWEWATGAAPGDEELGTMLEAGEVVRAVVPDLGPVEVRLNGSSGQLEVWLEVSRKSAPELRELLREGGRAAVYTLSGVGRDVRVELRGEGVLRQGLAALWRFGEGTFTLFERGAPETISI